ncbi:complement C5 [Symphorus nematophorus]
MKVCVLLMCVCCLCWRTTEADSRSYLITAPLSLRVDALETVLLQLFGFTDEVNVYVFLKTSMAPDHVVLAREAVTLNAQNHHQATARIRLSPQQLDKSLNHVILHVQSAEINRHLSIPVSRTNGFLFIQTDKPLYTPHQSVKVRVFSLNQELRPANRSVFLTFKDPDQTTVDFVEIFDINNGIPSLQNPFKIPIKPKLGIWSIEASYSGDFTTKAITDFEVKEYVLPSFSILVEPKVNFISYGQFKSFSFKLSARYLHGAPVADGEVFLRYGYVSGKNPPVIIASSVSRQTLSSTGELDVTVNMEKVLSKHDGPKDLDSLVGKYLYITVLLQEETGGLSQEVEFAAVKFVKSPYSLSLVSTPPFIKPGLPYHIQVLVRDHLDKPVNRVQVRLVERRLFSGDRDHGEMGCPDSSVSQSDGLAVFICNTESEGTKAVLKFETADPSLPAPSQATLMLTAVAYHSPNQRYLYIDPPPPGRSLEVGLYANIKVYSATPSYVPIKALSYLVISKGKVVEFDTKKFIASADNRQLLSFQVTPAMVPSIRLLVYYILFGEGTSELVADSIWLDVKAKCVNGLQTDLSYRQRDYRPKENLRLDIRTNQDGLVALSAVDSALYTLRPNYRDPVSMVLRRIEESDQGCGGGGGRDSADVFRLAGLTFITNANAQPVASDAACTAAVRPKRALSEEEKKKKVQSFSRRREQVCCEAGMKHIPKSITCEELSKHMKRHDCREAFRLCCEFLQRHLDQDRGLILARHALGADFDLAPSLVRSFFPESWMWEVQPVSGQKFAIRPLPDSLTTWEIKAVGMFRNGICVAEPVKVSVKLPLSVDVPLPYQVVRGEQLELKGSVYNQQLDSIQYCVTLTAGPAVCLLTSQPVAGGAGLHSTACDWRRLSAGGVGKVMFTVLGLEPGEHTLTFTLKTQNGPKDIVEKKLRVVPEGVKKEQFSVGTLDPQGLYGSEKRTVELKNKVPANIVPNTNVERLLTINGEVVSEVMSVMHDPDGLRQLVNLPPGSAEAELDGLLPLIYVYQYLETTGRWDFLGENIQKNSADLRRRIREGLVSISSFRRGDGSYSMWLKKESSTWLTALVVKTLSAVDPVISEDRRPHYRQSLSDSVSWLIRSAQQENGSFTDESSFRSSRVLVAGKDTIDQSVYLTSFVLIALHQATRIRDPILQLQFQDDAMTTAADYISQHAPAVKSVYVRAVATYALTLHDPNSMEASLLLDSLEKLAHQKGHPAVLRYWQESSMRADWRTPDKSSGLTVEMTAYVLLTVLLKGRIQYANPILSWLTQDQHYGEGFYSIQDTVLTLEALTKYSRVVPRAVLSQDINIRYRRKGQLLGQVYLSQTQPVARPIQVTKNDDIIVTTGYGRGWSTVKMKTVYYETTPAEQNCYFDLTVEVVGPEAAMSRVANLYMDEDESGALCFFRGTAPSHWIRYVEDTWVKSKTQEVEAVTDHINAVDRNFTCEDVRGNSLAFLDCAVHIEEDGSLNIEPGNALRQKLVHTKDRTPRHKHNNVVRNAQTCTLGKPNNRSSGMRAPSLSACAKYKPPPNELVTESGLTVMKIELSTGVEAYLEDLRMLGDFISHYELQGNTVIIQLEAVPSDVFLCVGFRIRTRFKVLGVTKSLFQVYEPEDKGTMCTKQFSFGQQQLQRLCVDDHCQCMTAACASYRGDIDVTLTAAKRTSETCQPHIKYAYRVTVKSSAAEGDFMTYTATVEEVLKNTDKAFEAVSSGTEVELVKKITCSSVDVQNNNQYLVMGSSGSELTVNNHFKYRLPLDSEALVELWPRDCSSPECLNYISQLEDFALELQLDSCPDASK